MTIRSMSGMVRADISTSLPGGNSSDLEMFPDRWEEFNRLSGLGRVGKPEEIAALIAYLVSDEAGYVTGQNYPICGLWNLGRA